MVNSKLKKIIDEKGINNLSSIEKNVLLYSACSSNSEFSLNESELKLLANDPTIQAYKYPLFDHGYYPRKLLGNPRDQGNILISAIIARDNTVVKKLLDLGFDLNARSALGYYALHYAVARGNFEAVKLLCEKGAQKQFPDCCGYTPLEIAYRIDFLESFKIGYDTPSFKAIAEYLLDKNRDIFYYLHV